MVGALVGVAKGEMQKQDVERMLEKAKREINIKTLPAKGLCLIDVEY